MLIILLVVVLATAYVFSPYFALRPRTSEERWTTRERSYGHPYYWKLRYGEHCDEKCDPGNSDGCKPEGWSERHHEAYNRRNKIVRTCKNVVYIE